MIGKSLVNGWFRQHDRGGLRCWMDWVGGRMLMYNTFLSEDSCCGTDEAMIVIMLRRVPDE